jgi:hypothetical protein
MNCDAWLCVYFDVGIQFIVEGKGHAIKIQAQFGSILRLVDYLIHNLFGEKTLTIRSLFTAFQ